MLYDGIDLHEEHLSRLPRTQPELKSVSSDKSFHQEKSHALIVDDDALTREMLQHLLETLDISSDIAVNGNDAISRILSRQYDLILLDLVMPHAGGVEVLQAMEKIHRQEQTDVIIVSGVSDPARKRDIYHFGFTDYVDKAIDPELLQARIKLCLEKRSEKVRILQRVRTLESQQKTSQRLLHQFVPENLRFSIIHWDRNYPHSFDDVVVLFADIVGYTNYCSNHTAHEVYKYLNTTFNSFYQIARRHCMYRIKTIGDAFMCISSLDHHATYNQSQATIKCGLSMIEYINTHEPFLNLRVGIASGPVTVCISDNSHMAIDVWGDAVNLASRLESIGAVNAVTFTEHIRNQAGQMPSVCRKDCPIKGKGVMDVYETRRRKTLKGDFHV